MSKDPLVYDVWRHIATYLTPSELRRAISTNHALHDIAMDTIYGKVRWTRLDYDMVKSLKSLQNPRIAKRVHRLDVRLWFLKFQFDESLQRHFERLPKFKLQNLSDSQENSTQVHERLADLKRGGIDATIRVMESAMNNLQELYECSLDARWLPSEALPLMHAVYRTFSQNQLRKLELRCQDIEELGNPATMCHLINLRELSLEIVGPPKHSPSEQAQMIQMAEFMSKLDLCSFSLSTSPHSDYSAFFAALGRFPHLRKLVLRVDLSEESLSDPYPLLCFLHRVSPQLESFQFQPRFSDRNYVSLFASLIQAPYILSDLQTLTISNVPDFDLVLSLLRRSKETIAAVTLEDSLDLQQLQEIVLALTHDGKGTLKTLGIKIQVLSPAIFDLLSRRLPNLRDLQVVYNAIGGSYLDDDEREVHPPIEDVTVIEIFNVGEPGSPPRYRHWALQKLSVWMNQVHEALSEEEEGIMFSVAHASPRITTIRGETFINAATGSGIGGALEIGYGEVQVSKCLISGTSIVLLEVPSSEDLGKFLVFLSKWLEKASEMDLKIAGVIYIHSINNIIHALDSLPFLGSLDAGCASSFQSIVLVTSMWGTGTNNVHSQRECQLITEHWKPFLDRGSTAVRFLNTTHSALSILSNLLPCNRGTPPTGCSQRIDAQPENGHYPHVSLLAALLCASSFSSFGGSGVDVWKEAVRATLTIMNPPATYQGHRYLFLYIASFAAELLFAISVQVEEGLSYLEVADTVYYLNQYMAQTKGALERLEILVTSSRLSIPHSGPQAEGNTPLKTTVVQAGSVSLHGLNRIVHLQQSIARVESLVKVGLANCATVPLAPRPLKETVSDIAPITVEPLPSNIRSEKPPYPKLVFDARLLSHSPKNSPATPTHWKPNSTYVDKGSTRASPVIQFDCATYPSSLMTSFLEENGQREFKPSFSSLAPFIPEDTFTATPTRCLSAGDATSINKSNASLTSDTSLRSNSISTHNNSNIFDIPRPFPIPGTPASTPYPVDNDDNVNQSPRRTTSNGTSSYLSSLIGLYVDQLPETKADVWLSNRETATVTIYVNQLFRVEGDHFHGAINGSNSVGGLGNVYHGGGDVFNGSIHGCNVGGRSNSNAVTNELNEAIRLVADYKPGAA
ncbi:hypothetical protein EYR40_002639 [Pleurotus pulmonarius]|nr:hypothetical protein EYR40_002639 [Pleurotus pulmonarius]